MMYHKRHKYDKGAVIVEFALIAMSIMLLILMVVVGGVTLSQKIILEKSAELALPVAARIDQDVAVNNIALDTQVNCTGTTPGNAPSCGLITAAMYDDIVQAAQRLGYSFDPANIQITYGRYQTGISVVVKLRYPSLWSQVLGDGSALVTGQAYNFVVSKPT